MILYYSKNGGSTIKTACHQASIELVDQLFDKLVVLLLQLCNNPGKTGRHGSVHRDPLRASKKSQKNNGLQFTTWVGGTFPSYFWLFWSPTIYVYICYITVEKIVFECTSSSTFNLRNDHFLPFHACQAQATTTFIHIQHEQRIMPNPNHYKTWRKICPVTTYPKP